jgi:hypothetical protein
LFGDNAVVISQMLTLRRRRSDLGGIIDPQRIMVAGHSDGRRPSASATRCCASIHAQWWPTRACEGSAGTN